MDNQELNLRRDWADLAYGGTSKTHWSELPEQATRYSHVRLMMILFRMLPMPVVRVLTFPVAVSYFIVSKRSRKESKRYLNFMAEALKTEGKKFRRSVFHHFHSFAITVTEKVEAWGGKVKLGRIHFQDDDIRLLKNQLEAGQGALLICSHLGNAELLRALADFNRTGVPREVPVTSIVDFQVNPFFNRMLQELNPKYTLRVISAAEIGPQTIIMIQDRLAAGEMVVITGDRTSANTRNKYLTAPFLGRNAPFGYGPFFLAALLNAPTYFVFAIRRKDVSIDSHYDMHVHKSPVNFNCPRKNREERIETLARLYVEKLEYYCKQHPYQWYNFYDFWAEPDPADKPQWE